MAVLSRPVVGPPKCQHLTASKRHPMRIEGGLKALDVLKSLAALALSTNIGLHSVAHAMEGIKIEPGVTASEQYFQTVPQGLDSDDDKDDKNSRPVKLSTYLEGPKGKEIQQCARRCTSTCIRGGQGAPGIGPMALRKEVVVFKPGYRSGKYCLNECIQICALQINGNK